MQSEIDSWKMAAVKIIRLRGKSLIIPATRYSVP